MKHDARWVIVLLLGACMLAFLGLVWAAHAAPAAADSDSYTGTIRGDGPGFFVPDVTGVTTGGCAPVTTTAAADRTLYQAQLFTVSMDGTYRLANTGNTFASPTLSQDSVLLLYSPTFDPAAPVQHLVGASDDRSPFDGRALLQCALQAGVPYVLVTTAFSYQTTGQFTNDITGPGVVTLQRAAPAPTAVPSPAAAGPPALISGPWPPCDAWWCAPTR